MSKLNCTPKPRLHHRTLNLPVPQHPRHILLQQWQPHNHHLSRGGLKSCCSSAVHIHDMPTVINTASVAAFGRLFHLCFAIVFRMFCFSSRYCFLVVKLMLFIELGNDNCCRNRTVCFAGFPVPFIISFSPWITQDSAVAASVVAGGRSGHPGTLFENVSFVHPLL
jgi:hypothetical protein